MTMLTVALVLGTSATIAGTQVRFEVPEPFRVGPHAYASGVISVRSVAAYNPTTSLLEVRVNGDCIGMVTARHDDSEVPPARTEAIFRRDHDGRLVMIGYRVMDDTDGTTYRFEEPEPAQAALAVAAY
jgi:hypothetical protein